MALKGGKTSRRLRAGQTLALNIVVNANIETQHHRPHCVIIIARFALPNGLKNDANRGAHVLQSAA
ncbi:hypothetical protein KUC_1144 [Vreelandella boliviensis LC1]|uniref:Uncharacterized protein n=1 Tax=Vreelandella boliviensis LC1 TaxID=1072583 RepID=A0A7U9C2W8_9GAMM|nr:hypothetical protein KUC_1144 [Halomonas boliviensis LC1]